MFHCPTCGERKSPAKGLDCAECGGKLRICRWCKTGREPLRFEATEKSAFQGVCEICVEEFHAYERKLAAAKKSGALYDFKVDLESPPEVLAEQKRLKDETRRLAAKSKSALVTKLRQEWVAHNPNGAEDEWLEYYATRFPPEESE